MANQPSTADNILACARSLIIAGGYNGFSYADIASEIGIRKASIHHHFPSKVDLVRILVARYRAEAETALAELERQVPEPLALLTTYVGFWEKCIMDASLSFCVCALLASELPVLPQDVALEVRAYFKTLSGWLTGIMERGEQERRLRLANSPRVEAEMLMAAVHGGMLSARAYDDPAVFGMVAEPLLGRLAAVN